MTYKERVPKEQIEFIRERVDQRGEELEDWAKTLKLSKSFLSHILSQRKPLPDNRKFLWDNMLKILATEREYERKRKKHEFDF